METHIKLDKIAHDFIKNTCKEGDGNFFNETYLLLQKIQSILVGGAKHDFEKAIKVFERYNTPTIM